MASRPSSSRCSSRTRRFNGMARTSQQWDSLRRDQEMWLEDGDCLVHYYARGLSQRGPSLKVPFSAVKAAASSYLLEQCLVVRKEPILSATNSNSSDSEYESPQAYAKSYELFVSAPADLTREQTYAYHITTRNYFAYLTGRPALVGEKLGTALADLYVRLQQWHPGSDSTAKLLEFCEDQGYMKLAENTHYATAVLNLAEKAQLRDLWIHAFVHCVGMHDRLDWSPEFDSLSNVTKAIVTRASLEMDLHITRVIRAFGGFLDEELGSEHLGLSKAARDHLDRFRGFLHNYYMEKLGYFPPSNNERFDKRLWTDMCRDFYSLYMLLVDTESNHDMASNLSLNGGVCVLQNIQAFDRRHGYDSLPHPQPLLPQIDTTRRVTDTQKALRSFKLGRMDSSSSTTPTAAPKLPPRLALANAINSSNKGLMAQAIVQEYQRFERQKLEDKISIIEARKVRWLLIYGALQMLISITRAPIEAKDVAAASYPLCVLTTGCPPWEESASTTESQMESAARCTPEAEISSEDVERISIHPDCEAGSAQDYFSLSRSSSTQALDQMAPPPLRITVPLSKTASIRSSVHSGVNALQRSVAGSFSRRNSWRSSTQMTPRRKPSHCEILVSGYGNGADAAEEESRQSALSQLEGNTSPQAVNSFADFDFGLNAVAEEDALNEPSYQSHHFDALARPAPLRLDCEPVLEDSQLNFAPFPRNSWVPDSAFAFGPTSSSSASSFSENDSPSSNSDSTRSSYASSTSCGTLATDFNSMAGSPISTAKPSLDLEKSLPAVPKRASSSTMMRRASYAQKHLNFGVSSSCTSLNVGCYSPSGMPPKTFKPATSRFASAAKNRSESVESSCSSVYPDESEQADEIEEEEMRGRRRSRAMDGVVRFSLEA